MLTTRIQNVKYLCSGFSYCISVLDTLWVWYGCGTTQTERDAAKRYSQSLASGKNVIEVEEGQEDEMFWMFLGDDGYARADYWKWKKQTAEMNEKHADPRIWRIEAARNGEEVCLCGAKPARLCDTDSVVGERARELSSCGRGCKSYCCATSGV